jgi:DNA-binding CsgD family transcriptional regulator
MRVSELQERNREMARQYKAGSTMAECGAPYGLSRQRVQQIFIEIGVARRSGKSRPVFNPDRDQFLAMMKNGLKPAQIASELGCSTNTVYEIRKRLGIEAAFANVRRGKSSDPNDPKNVTIRHLLGKGMTTKQVAEKMGMSRNAVQVRMLKAGIHSSYRGGRKRSARTECAR